MALIKCPECSKEVSDKSKICVNCGYPISEYISALEEKRKEQEEEQRIADIISSSSVTDNIDITCNKNLSIKIQDGFLTVNHKLLNKTWVITDEIQNFTLEFFDINMGKNVGFCIHNINQSYSSGVVDVMCSKEKKESLIRFKNTMERYGVFKNRRRTSVYYQKSDEDKELRRLMLANSQDEKAEVEKYCPKCGSKDYSAFAEQRVVPGKTKTQYKANLNPLKPFTLVNKKEKVIREEIIVTKGKFICNKCGNIFD